MKLIKLLAIASILLITGCATTVPVVAKFPEVPAALTEKCPALKTIDGETISIIDFIKTVTANYTSYHECSAKLDAWVEWYQSQKQIFEEIEGD